MFRSATTRLAARLGDLIDEMLLGDFDYILDGDRLRADVDYFREHPHQRELAWTPLAARATGPVRHVNAGPAARRPGTVTPKPAACLSPVSGSGSALLGRPATAAARSRTTR